jgi:hypothetical protein
MAQLYGPGWRVLHTETVTVAAGRSFPLHHHLGECLVVASVSGLNAAFGFGDELYPEMATA